MHGMNCKEKLVKIEEYETSEIISINLCCSLTKETFKQTGLQRLFA